MPTEHDHDPAQQFVGLTDGEWKAARDPRFAMIPLDPDTAEPVSALLREVAQEHDGDADPRGAVLVEGTVHGGDKLELLD